MELFIKFVTLLTLCVFKAKSMAIEGPALTRYDPCGLGVIYFERVRDNLWQGVVNLGLYPQLQDVVIEISFEKQVEIYGGTQNSSLFVKDDRHTFLMKPKEAIPKQFIFYLAMDDLNDLEGNKSEQAVPVVTRFSLNNAMLCNDAIKASHTVDSFNVTKTDSKDVNYQHVCGRRALENTELMSVRTESKAGDWPWHVAILIIDPDTFVEKYECGGNIISRTAIVTAGHCVSKDGINVEANRIIIIAGIDNHRDVNQIGRQRLRAEEVILHPGYSDVQATSDLAVIKINRLEYTEYVQPICIWGPVYDKSEIIGQQATVVGFGKTEDNESSDVLRSTYTLIQNDTTCVDFSPDVYEDLMNEFTFCAGYGPDSSINPRNGDSGGGLVLATLQSDHKISWFLRGVLSKCGVSPGQSECDPTYYVVYTDVGPHYGWLYHHAGLKFRTNILEMNK